MREKRRLWVAALIIAAVVVGGFVFSVPRAREVSEPASSTSADLVPIVTLHDSFAKGIHAITGSLTAPNVCSSLTATGSLEGQHIVITLTMPKDTQICLQTPTKMTFSVSVRAPLGAPIDVSVNGVLATTTRI